MERERKKTSAATAPEKKSTIARASAGAATAVAGPSSSGSACCFQPYPRELDKPLINSSRYEAYAIQDAIRKLGNVRAEVEAEVMAAIASASGTHPRDRVLPYKNYIGAGMSGGSVITNKAKSAGGHKRGLRMAPGVINPTAACETQQLVPQRVYCEATKKLNVRPNERLYHDLLELNVPPQPVKLKYAPKCEKKVDPSPCLEDYIKPQYCSIKPVRNYMATWSKCKIPQPSEDIENTPASPETPDPYQDDEDYRRDSEPEFCIG